MKYLSAFLAIALLQITAHCEDIYVAQTALGEDNGSSSANAKSIAWLNTSGNWGTGAGKISPGDTVHLVGTISTQLVVQGSGTEGLPITIFWEPDAKLSQPAGTLVSCQNKHYITFDGGTNGIIECTDNGSELGNQIGVSGIYASNSGNLTVRNLTIRNLYVHTLLSDSSIDEGSNAGIYMNGAGNNIIFHDLKFDHMCWAINVGGSIGSQNFQVYDCEFTNYDHGIAGPGGRMGVPANVSYHRNKFGPTANWDTDATAPFPNRYHHDGIHIYFAPGGSLSGVNISENIFYGDWGYNNTAHIFVEGSWDHAENTTNDFTVRNNIHIQHPGNYLNNGMAVGGGTNWTWENNTYIGAGVYNSAAVGGGLNTNMIFRNNIVTGFRTMLGVNSGTTFAPGGLTNNLYAAQAPGGNGLFWFGSAVSSLANWKTATGQDSNSVLVSSAGIDSGGVLQSGSPAIGSGLNLSGSFTIDYNGNARPASGPWDIGAYQYVGGSPTDTTPPTPNPSTIASTSKTDTTISVTATTATDAASPPVSYRFSRDDGSTWTSYQSGTSYTFTGLTPSTLYPLKVQTKDSVDNVTTASAITNVTTDSAVASTNNRLPASARLLTIGL